MNLDQIKIELEKNDFFAGIKDDYLMCGLLMDEDEETGIISLSDNFRIYLKESKICIKYSYGQIPKIESFDTMGKMIVFIKDTFPIEEKSNKK